MRSTENDTTEAQNGDNNSDELPRYELSRHHKRSDSDKIGPTDEHESPIRIIRQAYADVVADGGGEGRGALLERRALLAHTGWMTAPVARKCLQQIERYNAFRGEVLADALDDMPEDAYYAFGREGSPVFYVTTEHPEDAEGVLRNIEKEPELANRRGVPADTISVAPDEMYSCHSETYPRLSDDGAERAVVRAWWD